MLDNTITMRIILRVPLKTFQIIEMSISDDPSWAAPVVDAFHIYRVRSSSL